MSAQAKSFNGCWTCRLRHKKCDETTPICSGCRALEINCLYDNTKPEWMDNGPKQQEMANRVKTEIKRGATRRRGRKRIEKISREIGDAESSQGHVQTSSEVSPAGISFSSEGQKDDTIEGSKASRVPQNVLQKRKEFATPESSVVLDTTSSSISPRLDVVGLLLSQDERELSLIMSYLDYVFPVLFPFYRPPILEGSRSWMLVLIMKNKGTYHTVISLASFFFSVVPMLRGLENRICASMTSEELQKQADLAVKTVLRDSLEFCGQNEQQPLRDSADLMANVVQLLSFEIIIAPTQNWQMHLDAAIVLFEQIFRTYGMEVSSPSLSKVLALLLETPSMAMVSGVTLWTASQASFRFFSAMLLVNDIISSTSLERPPRLQKYHKYLLNDDHHVSDIQLQLEDFVGLENWVLLLVGEISSLDSWKKEMKKTGTLSMKQLVQGADEIEQQLRNGLSRLNCPQYSSRLESRPANPLAFFLPPPLDMTPNLTRIWAYAAHIYMLTIVSGWQPADPKVRENVRKLISLFKSLPSPALLRTLVWPFCVAGCLADELQESTFRGMVESMGPLQMFGTMRVALRIMENVWSKRAHIDPDSWDIAACLRCIGHRVLLV